jgi:hypothetical protein
MIVLEPSAVLGIPAGVAGAATGWNQYTPIASELPQRSSELPAFFNNRGILVVALEQPAQLTMPGFQVADISSYDWWMTCLGLSWKLTADAGLFLASGSGQVALVTDPAHPFGLYIELNSGFVVRLSDAVAADEHVTILAENRVQKAVAIEVTVSQGRAILVPAPQSQQWRDILYSTSELVWSQRGADDARWRLRTETALEEDLNRALEEVKVIRRRVREVKHQVLQLPHVARAVRYFETAIQGTPTPAKSLPHLYKAIETIEYRFGSEKQAAEALGVSVNTFKRIKRLANDPEFAIRHAPEDSVSEVKAAEFDAAIKDVASIVLLLIEMEVRATVGPNG